MVRQAVYEGGDGFGFGPVAGEQDAAASVINGRGPGADVGGPGVFALAGVQIGPLGCEIGVEGRDGRAMAHGFGRVFSAAEAGVDVRCFSRREWAFSLPDAEIVGAHCFCRITSVLSKSSVSLRLRP